MGKKSDKHADLSDPQLVRRRIQRACTNREIRDLLLKSLDQGTRMKVTPSGVVIYGSDGVCGTHFTCSDYRAVRNLRAAMRRVGALER